MLKQLLRNVLGKAILKQKELQPTLCDYEAIMNQRLSTFISEDSQDCAALTPAMFLQEIKEVGVPDLDAVQAKNLRRRYSYRIKLREELRRRYRNKYLATMSIKQTKRNLKINYLKIADVVLVGNDISQ